ncbi:lysine--tRNA ligase [Candidatus Kaiserbacteria bacterium]|nr:lysine--tRNA ligase [Candidatus Kaiserbacteria bacterium]
MFWADRVVEDIAKSAKPGQKLVVRDEKTASGRVHIGSMRGVAIHGVVTRVLNERGFNAEYLYEINDFDPMDGIPAELPTADWEQYLGLPLCTVPSPDGKAKNFAEYYAGEFEGVIKDAGFDPKYYRASELYISGKMNDAIRIALKNAGEIRRIYFEVSGSKKEDTWLPVSMVCEKCGKIGTTQAHGFDGEKVYYKCIAGAGGAKGCGHEGGASPFNGGGKLPWKVEWPAKWQVLDVAVEGAGKDHSTKGGARDVAEHISREVFKHEPPHNIPYEFFLDSEGRKMSASKGRGVSSREIADNFPPIIFRLALIGKDPNQQFIIDPVGETLLTLYDWHDKLAEKFWAKAGDEDARLFEIVYDNHPPLQRFLPRFSTVAFVLQMEHLTLEDEFGAIKGDVLTDDEKADLKERAHYAGIWLRHYAPDKYKFTLARDAIPEAARALTDEQKQALLKVRTFIKESGILNGPKLHEALHNIKKETGIPANAFFAAIYLAFLGRDSGPQAGWFLSTLDKEFLLGRLAEVT